MGGLVDVEGQASREAATGGTMAGGATHVVIKNNTAGTDGGGIYEAGGSQSPSSGHASLADVTFIHNTLERLHRLLSQGQGHGPGERQKAISRVRRSHEPFGT